MNTQAFNEARAAVSRVQASPVCSDWLRISLESALDRDICDVLDDVDTMQALLNAMLNAILSN